MSDETPDEVAKLQERVGNGLQWLSDNDPTGAFYAWFQTGLTPVSRIPKWEELPADEQERLRGEWAAWYKAKQTYDQLDRRLAALEERGLAPLPWALPWVPQTAVRR